MSVAEHANISFDTAKSVIKAFTETIKEQLSQDEKVRILGFGTFEVRKRAARTGRNPSTGEIINIPAALIPVFHPGSELKKKVNRKSRREP